MEYRKFGKMDETPSLLGFGCMRFPETEDGHIDEEKAQNLLEYAMDHGVTYIDTANPYHNGESEPFVGRILKNHERNTFYLATKLPMWDIKTLDDAKAIFTSQLERLQVDYIDFYLLHALDKAKWDTIVKLDILGYLEEMKAQGKIRHIGFSFHDEYEVFEEIITYRKWDFCQIQLNYMDRDIQQGMAGYELAEKLGVPLVIMEPNKGGQLVRLPKDIADIFQAYDANASMASWAMRWVASLPNVKVVLSGMSTMEQVQDNLNTFEDFKLLNEKEQTIVEEVTRVIKSRMKNGCTACAYCMPCPFGVDIPGNFKVWNNQAMYQNHEATAKKVSSLKQKGFASFCKECGACESKCPQHIAIRKDLKQVVCDIGEFDKESVYASSK